MRLSLAPSGRKPFSLEFDNMASILKIHTFEVELHHLECSRQENK